ncbi:uncharacterized protein EV420DRAFT_628492 [Desarmillaria tabescens]|uniref:Uncharacterized protein n=1 Tax=Armillaria tabescens TaxID=1929756 RepID=A0AA39MZY3_ARMTA|nr:uncharacterized protein EV420DRAFT_628492 [Desarmillaria tabescens]KAK0452882.1 hypothetical protein EV420DRAFT_628492 [Desarmillaria tabescens]
MKNVNAADGNNSFTHCAWTTVNVASLVKHWFHHRARYFSFHPYTQRKFVIISQCEESSRCTRRTLGELPVASVTLEPGYDGFVDEEKTHGALQRNCECTYAPPVLALKVIGLEMLPKYASLAMIILHDRVFDHLLGRLPKRRSPEGVGMEYGGKNRVDTPLLKSVPCR